MDRTACLRLDEADRLARHRARFLVPRNVTYLDGNSLGVLPRGVAERLQHTIRHEWGELLIRSWNESGWASLPRTVGDRLGRLIGAPAGTVVVCDSTSVNLFKVAMAAASLRSGRRFIVTDAGNFPTDIYVMRGVAAHLGLELCMVDPVDVESALSSETAVVALTEVDYRTGRRHDMGRLTAATHAAGALSVWDLSHSAGAFPVDLASCNVDLAVGCGYKYLNGGPGAPAFVYVAPHLHDVMANPITGWFGHARPFDFDLEFEPASGVDRFRVGTPHVLSLVALDEALAVFEDVDMERVREKSERLTEMFMALIERRLPGLFEIATPRVPQDRGSHVSLRHPHAYQIVQALIARGVIGDFRAPDLARFGFAPLYVRYVDVWDAVEHLTQVMDTEAWRDPRFDLRNPVT